MPVKTISRQERKSLTRTSLKDAARRCFAERGYDATGIADIARAAGVANGTFYVHFSGIEDLVDEMLAEFNDAFARRLEPIVMAATAGTASVEVVVRAAAEKMLDHWRANRAFIECYLQRSTSALSLASVRDGVNPPMAALLRQALERVAGGRADFHADLVTQALLGMWLRVGLQYLFNKQVSRSDAVETLVRLTVGAANAVLDTKRASDAPVSPRKGR